jgi:putative DNA primase/helicase
MLDPTKYSVIAAAPSDPTSEEPRPPAFTDEALALRFAEKHAGRLRYVSSWSRWFIWDGRCWRRDETLFAFDCAREICRSAANECSRAKVATAIASAKTVAAVERLAKADRRLAATTDQWDTDKWALNTPGGVIDLKTGEIRTHSCIEYITKTAAVAPAGKCPIWLRHLDRVTGGDAALLNYLKRVFGYGLTGCTDEHSVFFQYGTGANGKSVTTNTVAGILADYHRTAAIETFTASRGERHPTDLAGLRGARLVTATETEEGRRWAEARIKALTGGDPVSARFMKQDFFEYVPQFKLLISGNHKPGLRSVDEAIRRRFHLIPYGITIPVEERDDGLFETLKAEWPGILAWMIEGCLEWQRDGLALPDVVRSATDDYLNAEDAIAAWIEDCCETNAAAWERSGDLFASWKAWADRNGELPGSARRFSNNLEARGFAPRRTREARGFGGLQLVRESGLDWGR